MGRWSRWIRSFVRGVEAVDSASLGYWWAVMLERIGEFPFGADGS